MIQLLKSKIHWATVTDANVNYEGSISIYHEYMDKIGILEYEKVLVVNVNNGKRFETYVIRGADPNNVFCVNGVAARLVSVDDKIIIMAFIGMEAEKETGHIPRVITLDDSNKVISGVFGRGCEQ